MSSNGTEDNLPMFIVTDCLSSVNESFCLYHDYGSNDTTAYSNGSAVATENSRNARDQNSLLFDISYRAKLYLSQPAFIIALVLGCLAIILNILSIIALLQIRHKLNTHYRLIISLSLSDALIGFSIIFHVLNKILNPSLVPGLGPTQPRLVSRCVFIVIKALNNTGLVLSLLNLMLMSVDHFLAISKPLQYPYLSRTPLTRIAIICVWIVAFLCGFSDFFSGYFYPSAAGARASLRAASYGFGPVTYNYCERVFLSVYNEEFSVLVTAVVCLVVMLTLYVNIYIKIRRHKSPGEAPELRQSQRREQKRNRKALVTTLLVLGSFILCWIPLCLFQITLLVLVQGFRVNVPVSLLSILMKTDKYLFDILLINCISDPIIYTARCVEVRQGYRCLFRICGITATPQSNTTGFNSSVRRTDVRWRYTSATQHTSVNSPRVTSRGISTVGSPLVKYTKNQSNGNGMHGDGAIEELRCEM